MLQPAYCGGGQGLVPCQGLRGVDGWLQVSVGGGDIYILSNILFSNSHPPSILPYLFYKYYSNISFIIHYLISTIH